MDPEDMLSQFAESFEPAAIPESHPAQLEDEEDFGTIRTYFDAVTYDGDYFGFTRGIGKLYDHMVNLYSDGGKRLHLYEAVLKTIKDCVNAHHAEYGDWYDDPSRELLEDAEKRLMRIATDKTNNETERRHRLQNQNSNNNNKDNIVGIGDKFPDFYHLSFWPYDYEMAWRVLFHHVVKMDEGNCSSLYKSVLQLVFRNPGGMGEVGRKLEEIEKRKGENGFTVTKEVIVDNATTDLQKRLTPYMNDEDASLIMRWAMSDRLIIQEIHFKEERDYVIDDDDVDGLYRLYGMLGILYDHIEELDGGQYRYKYIKAFRKLFKQILSQRDGNQTDNLIDEVEAVFKEIAMEKMDINETKYQEVSKSVEEQMRYYYIKLFKGNLNDEDDEAEQFEKVELLANHIPVIYRHLLILDGCDCLDLYKKAFEGIKDNYELLCWILRSSEIPEQVIYEVDKLYDGNLHSVRNTLKEIVEKKNKNNISKQTENVVAATAGDTEEASSSYMVRNDGDADVRPVIQPRNKWLDSSEILDILQNFKSFQMSKEIQQKPPSGSLILYNTKALRFYKKDGYNWQKQKDGKTVTEGHMILKVGGHQKLHCYYGHSIDDEKFQRRTYSLRNKSSSIRLVHYLDVNSEDNDTSENVGREVEDNALEVGHDFPTRMKSSGTSSWTKKRPRRESDGDDMNKEIGTTSQNANRAISTNTPLDDEMAQLANKVESLPGFGTESDRFYLAMESFKDEKNRALFKAMKDRNSQVRMLEKILKL